MSGAPEPPPARRSRFGPLFILMMVPVLFVSGIPGVHGGGFGTGAALFMSLLSVPVGVLTIIWGLSISPRSAGLRFTVIYLLACWVAFFLALYDLSGHS